MEGAFVAVLLASCPAFAVCSASAPARCLSALLGPELVLQPPRAIQRDFRLGPRPCPGGPSCLAVKGTGRLLVG